MSENLADKGMAEHCKLIRESQDYRNFLMMEELQAEMQPPWGSREEELPNSSNLEYNDKYINNTIYTNKEFKQLRGMVLFIQSKLNEHLDKTKSRLEDGY